MLRLRRHLLDPGTGIVATVAQEQGCCAGVGRAITGGNREYRLSNPYPKRHCPEGEALDQPAGRKAVMSKIAMVTGATSGFGAATVHKFAKAGWRIVATGRRADRLKQLASECGADK